ncbi:hypothetical protein PUL39_030530 [Pseudomonas aeruginosa]|uniref:DUF7364 domain-containing protein n=1 Tax=Pseudomonas aeruginosa TaxID=287 RepID=UPI0023B0C694|nr:hypothetical protein [Pseudomonas aeruginosa]MDE8660780.1 hypothetical protein [Pseudomonas aeruginosa]
MDEVHRRRLRAELLEVGFNQCCLDLMEAMEVEFSLAEDQRECIEQLGRFLREGIGKLTALSERGSRRRYRRQRSLKFLPLAKRLGRVIYCANPRQISRRATPGAEAETGPATVCEARCPNSSGGSATLLHGKSQHA